MTDYQSLLEELEVKFEQSFESLNKDQQISILSNIESVIETLEDYVLENRYKELEDE